MYANIKSCVPFNGKSSDFFECRNGLTQGENLSPILFSMFLNDLESFLLNENNFGLNIFDESIQIFFRLDVLLYADDTVYLQKVKKNYSSCLMNFNQIV